MRARAQVAAAVVDKVASKSVQRAEK